MRLWSNQVLKSSISVFDGISVGHYFHVRSNIYVGLYLHRTISGGSYCYLGGAKNNSYYNNMGNLLMDRFNGKCNSLSSSALTDLSIIESMLPSLGLDLLNDELSNDYKCFGYVSNYSSNSFQLGINGLVLFTIGEPIPECCNDLDFHPIVKFLGG